MAFDVWTVVHPTALDVIHRHVMSSSDVEVGGFLVGTSGDERTPPRCVAAIEARAAVGDLTRLTFTHDAWEHVHRELEAKHPACSIIGWYHSHPGHGIFLSQHDQFIHRNFFSAPWQIAIVVDPVHETEGLFLWTGGEISLASERDVGGAATTTSGDSPGHAAPFTRGDTVVSPTKRERLVVAPDDPPDTAITPMPPQAADHGPRDAIVLLREPDQPPEPGEHHHVADQPDAAPEPGSLAWQQPPDPPRTPGAPRYPLAGYLVPVAAGVATGLALSIAIF